MTTAPARVVLLLLGEDSGRDFDRLGRPKDDASLCCLADRHNLRLAETFPAEALYDVRKSFTASVDELLGDEGLLQALGTFR